MAVRRFMSLDVGSRRIGIALTDELQAAAHPLLTLARKAPREDLRSIARLVRRYDVAHIVVGLPLHASGEESPQSRKTRSFAHDLNLHLAEVLPQHGVQPPVFSWMDERHTTRGAHDLLDTLQGTRHSAADRRERSQQIDQVAAVAILQAWLEQHRGPSLLPDPETGLPPADL